jgi:polysaccharide biosynthesis/export protein
MRVRGLLSAFARISLVCLAASALAGCAMFPAQGPDPSQVVGEASGANGKLPYLVVDLSQTNLPVLQRNRIQALGGSLRDAGGAATLRLGVGDIVNVTIFEAAAGGLFIPSDAGSRAGNFVQLPAQEVNRNGTITVPYAGAVPAAGRTPQDVQATIVSRLQNRAIEPQALVTLQEARSSLVSVTGEVNQPVRFAITRSGDRILDAITRAGGSKWPPFETYVTLQRGSNVSTVYFNRLVNEPSNNVFLRPGDTIILKREARTFMALGASGQNGHINFDQETLKLSEAIGRAGAVLDSRGDPAQIFIYRLESRQVVKDLGYDTSGYTSSLVPVVYRINMREPQGFFLASAFVMQPKDVLFVSNSPAVELAKVLSLIQLAANTVTDSDAARISVKGGRR